jgi:hypothetical protein
MQAFKFAFETVMIGALAIPWLLLVIHMVSPDVLSSSPNRLLSPVPKELRSPLVSIAAFTFAYLAGSAILPVAGEFLNDKDLIGSFLPTERKIQETVYKSMDRKPGIRLASFRSAPQGDPPLEGSHEDFLFRESALLLHGTDACERLNRLHERLAVLSGATFNSFVLVLVCGFAACATMRASLKSRAARWAAFLPSGVLILVALIFGAGDLHKAEIDDWPILEGVLLAIGILGAYVTARGTRWNVRLHAWAFPFAMFFTVLSYGGYVCTEVSYDQDVLASYQALRGASTVTPATLGSGTSNNSSVE